MILLIGQFQGMALKPIRLEGVTSVLIKRAIGDQPTGPIAAILQLTPNSYWISSRGDDDFQSTIDDLGLTRLAVLLEAVVRYPSFLSVQVMQGLQATTHLVDVDHVAVLDEFDQAIFLARMVTSSSAWLGRLKDKDFDKQLDALGLGQSTLNVDSLNQDDYLTGTIAG